MDCRRELNRLREEIGSPDGSLARDRFFPCRLDSLLCSTLVYMISDGVRR
jgi:hypothetical protein